MVSKKRGSKKSAFTLIEVIFAIVVVSLTLLTLPMVTQVTSDEVEDSLAQEAIFAASAELNEALSAQWDENSLKDENLSVYARVINTKAACVDSKKAGHVSRRCLEDSTQNAQNSAGGAVEDLHDMAHVAQDILITDDNSSTAVVANATGYKKIYKSTFEVAVDASNSDIKHLTITIANPNDENITVLKAVSTNIGEVDIRKRSF